MKRTLLLTVRIITCICTATALHAQGPDENFQYSAGPEAGTGGNHNVFIGYRAGAENVLGHYNVFVGYRAGERNEGDQNAIFGARAGTHNVGFLNSFFGTNSGAVTTTGGDNSFFGAYSAQANTTGNNNSVFGSFAAYATQTGNNNSYFGYRSAYSARSSNNVMSGHESGYNTTTGGQNVFVGTGAGYWNTTGAYNTVLGIYAGQASTSGGLTNTTAIGSRARVSASNSMVLGSIAGVNSATANIKVGILTTAPAYTLHVNAADAAKVGGGSWRVASDKNLKENISEFEDGLSMIEKIKPVWFSYNGKAGIQTKEKFVGVIAQDMQKIAPYTVGEFTYLDTNGNAEKYLDYDPGSLTYVLINAVKEQQQMILALQEELQQVKKLLNEGNVNGNDPKAMLWQNEPNPALSSTVIRYFIPDNTRSAHIDVYSSNGQLISSNNIGNKGRGSLTLNRSNLSRGTYFYRLIVDGQSVASKKLIWNR